MLNRPSKAVVVRVAAGIVALLAALTLPLMSHDVGLAQEAPIAYEENDTVPVASFTAIDPETGSSIKWSLVTDAVGDVTEADVADHGDFTISSSGVLNFKSPPNYEAAADDNTNNEYKVTVQARGSGSGDSSYYELVVNVTNVEEAGTVTLTTLQPQVRVILTASVSDPDQNVTGTTWQWYNSSDMSTWDEIDKATQAAYLPAVSDAGKYLRAVATYTDDKNNPKDDPATADVDESKDTAMAASAAVLASTTTNAAPDYKDNEGESRPDSGEGSSVAIPLKESAVGGDAVGNPVTAVDDDTLTYTMADTDAAEAHAALFTIDRPSGQISVKAGTTFDFTGDHEAAAAKTGPYNVTVTATDPTGAIDSVPVVISITDVNEKPTIAAAVTDGDGAGFAAIKRAEGGEGDAALALTGAVYTATDSDNPLNDAVDPQPANDMLEWTLSGPDAGKFRLSEPSGDADTGFPTTLTFANAPNYEAKADADGNNDYEVTVVVTDSAGNKATRDVTVTIENAEENGTVKVSLLRPQVGTQLVAEVSDPDGDVSGVTWQWWRTTAGDDENALTVVPTIADFNDFNVVPPANRRGDGDPNGDGATVWEKVPGGTSSSYRPVAADTGKFLLAIATYADGKSNTEDDSESALVDETERDRTSLVVGDTNPDPEVVTDTLSVRVVQTSNSAPQFDDTDPVADGRQNDPRERKVKENTSGFVGTAVMADDPDTTAADVTPARIDTETHSLGGPDAALFEIDQRSGQISVGAGTKLNFEAEKNTYQVTVTATDPSGASTTTTVNIVVTDVNEAPKITITPGEASIDYPERDTAPVASFTAIDPETGSSIKWSLVTDAVGDVTEADVADHGDFTISSSGVLNFKSPPNYEAAADDNTNNEYKVTVQARGSGSGDTAYYELGVNVTNVEEAGTVTLTTLQPQVRVTLTASVSDPDQNVTGTTWQWYNSSDMSTWDEIDKATQAAYKPAVSDAGKYLRAVATYTDDKNNPKDDPATADVDESKDTAMAASAAVLASTTTNAAPDYKDDEGESRPDSGEGSSVAIPLKESAVGGDAVGNPVTAVDDDTLTYTMADTDAAEAHAALFTIDRPSGQISVKAGTTFDFTGDHEAAAAKTGPYNVTVTATDPTGAIDSVPVVISITDVNEKPTIAAAVTDGDGAGFAAIKRAEGGEGDAALALTGAVYTATDSDNPLNDAVDPQPANDMLEWTLSGPDAGKFRLSEPSGDADTGFPTTLTFANAPNYEAKADADGNNDYEVTVVVTDSAGNKATRDVTVTIENAEENGTVKVSLLRPQVGTQLVAEVSDPDGDVSGVTWQWWRTTAGDDENALTVVPTIADFNDFNVVPPANRRGDGDPNGDGATVWEKVPGGTSSSYRSVEDDTGKFLLAIATYDDGKSNTEDDAATDDVDETERDRTSLVVGDTNPDPENDEDTLSVRVVQTSNSAPQFDDTDPVADGRQNDPRERKVKENTSGFVGTAVMADDPDTTAADVTPARIDTETHSLGGPDAALFEIDQRSGQISVGAGTKLNFEAEKNTYQVTVTATDPSGASTTTTVNIVVTDVNEAPKITFTPGGSTPPSEGVVGGDAAPSYRENGRGAVGTYNTTITSPSSWTLSGPDAGDFSISSGGVLSFNSSPDYEAPTDANNNNVYMVTVMANNGNGGAELDVTVTVTNDTSDDPTTPTPGAFDPLSYDADDSGTIDRLEVITAIRHYFADQITRDQVILVIRAYFGNGS